MKSKGMRWVSASAKIIYIMLSGAINIIVQQCWF